MSVTQYIGARYVPMFAEPIDWDIKKPYSPLTIVYHQGNSYTSKQSVPANTDINNSTYWALTGNYNAQIDQYRAEVVAAKTGADTANANNTTQDAQIAGTTDSGLKTLINAEHTTNVTQDAQLAGTAESGIKTLITNESTARGTKDTALDAQLAGTTDSGLKTLITDESSARSTKDTALDAQLAGTTDSGLKTLITNESTARTDSDATLASNISAETTARTNADNTITASINAEKTRATAAENALDAKIPVVKAKKTVITIGDSYFCDNPGVRNSIVTELKTIATNWNITNYADSGAAFTFGGARGYTFLHQLQNAAAAQTPADVDVVIIAGGRNEAGAQDSERTPASNLYTVASACLAYAKKTFVNAKIYMFPLLYDWKAPNSDCYYALTQIEKACADNNIWYARGCYTWGSGEQADKYVGGDDIHPNTAGALFMAKMMLTAIEDNNPIVYVNRCAIVNSSLFVFMSDGYIVMKGGLTTNGTNGVLADINTLPSWLQPTVPAHTIPITAIDHNTGNTNIIVLDSTGIHVPGTTPASGILYMLMVTTKYNL